MKKREIIIFGRSPFINKLHFENLDYNRFDICCINQPIAQLKRIDYLVSVDAWTKPEIPDGCEWISVNNGWEFIKGSAIIQQEKKLSWKHYSSDLAVNFAIMRGYKHIYIAGVDMVEDDKPFVHYDGSVNTIKNSAEGCRDEKFTIRQLGNKFGVLLYQLNPESKWLNFADIGLL